MADPHAIQAYLEKTDEELRSYIDPTHRSYTDVYLGRAHARHARDDPPREVLRELWLASKCFAEHAEVNLAKWPTHRLKSRRLLPLELGLIGGDPEVIRIVAMVQGVEIMQIMARTESRKLTEEIYSLTPYFRRGRVSDVIELVGTLAVLYCTGLTALLQADGPSFKVSVRTAHDVTQASARLMGGDLPGGLARLLAAHGALGAMAAGQVLPFRASIREHMRLHREVHEAQDAATLRIGAGALDTTSLALVAGALAVGIELGPNDIGPLGPYLSILQVHEEPEEEDEEMEMVELSEEDQAKLEKLMGTVANKPESPDDGA